MAELHNFSKNINNLSGTRRETTQMFGLSCISSPFLSLLVNDYSSKYVAVTTYYKEQTKIEFVVSENVFPPQHN